MWFAGVDWADTKHDILVIDEAGRQIGIRQVTHTAQGLDELKTFLTSITGPERKADMACIVETNHGLLITALLEAGFSVYPVNPKTVDRKRNASGAKTDRIDAYLLAKHGRSELADLRRLEPDSPIIAELKALTRDQDGLIQMQTRLVNQLTACLKAYFPVALNLFGKLQQRSTLLFLQAYPTLEAVRSASVEQFIAQLVQTGYPNPKKAAPKIFELVHQPQLQADDVTVRTRSRLTLALIRQLLPVVEEISAYDEEIERLFLSHEDNEVFHSLPRAGRRLAPRLLAEIGDDASRYVKAGSLQALAGTSPVLYESGKYSKPHRRYACIKPLRNALHQFAWQSTHQEAWAREYYDRKRAEGKSHSVAVRALANVWASILFAMLQQKQCYQPTTFEQARKLHARKAA
ncbi:MAG TPA: IS110 family transposase [Ktedonobacteraceae bacterium]|nr:IS110 family transposase [Ktedonobacteraceae bacterium]